MHTTTVPASRLGWSGTPLEFVVKSDEPAEFSVPEDCAEGMEVRVLETRAVGGGTEAQVRVTPVSGSYY